MREQTLDRLIRIGLAVVAIGVLAVVAGRAFDWPGGEQTLLERELDAAEKAVRAQPEEVGLRLRLAEIYRGADRLDDALGQYQEVLDFEDGQTMALLGRGEVLAEQGDEEEAAKSFRRVIEEAGGEEFSGVDPLLAAAYYNLGSLLLEQGKGSQAVEPLRHAVQVQSMDADAWYLLGTAQLASGAPKPAVRALREAVLFVPMGWCEPYEGLSEAYAKLRQRPHARYAGAMVELCRERPAEAARQLRPLTSGPVAVDAMLGLGMAAEAQAERAVAARWYRKVLAADSDNFNARSNLGRLTEPGSPAGELPADHPETGGA